MAKTVYYGSEEFKADLQQFRDAIASITSSKDAIQSDLDKITTQMQDLASSWQGPAGQAFDQLQGPLTQAGQQMVDVISATISRMGITLQNYENAENANTKNFSQ